MPVKTFFFNNLIVKSVDLYISDNKSCLEIEFGWAPDYLNGLAASVQKEKTKGYQNLTKKIYYKC